MYKNQHPIVSLSTITGFDIEIHFGISIGFEAVNVDIIFICRTPKYITTYSYEILIMDDFHIIQ